MLQKKLFAVSLLFGLIAGISFLYDFLFFSIVISYAILIATNEYFLKGKTPFSDSISFFFLSFFSFASIASWWIVEASVGAYIVFVVIQSSIMLMFWYIVYTIRNHYPKISLFIVYSVPWIAMEYLQHRFFIKIPWLTLGNVFAAYPKLIQWYEYTGVLGGSLWIITFSVLLYLISDNFLKNKKVSILNIVAILLLCSFSFLFNYSNLLKHNSEIKICIIQTAINNYNEKFKPEFANYQDSLILELIDKSIQFKPDIIIAPETAIIHKIQKSNPTSNNIVNLLKQIIDSSNSNLMIGCYSHTGNTALFDEKQDSLFNSIIFFNNKKEPQFYDKQKLLFGIEHLSFGILSSIIGQLTDNDTIIKMYSGNNANSYKIKDSIRISPIICIESLFGEYTANKSNNTDLIVLITNDGWWSHPSGYKNFAHFSQIRAIENRSTLVRASNYGISSVITPKGEIKSISKYGENEILCKNIKLYNTNTFYQKYGDLIGKLSITVLILIILKYIREKYVFFLNRG